MTTCSGAELDQQRDVALAYLVWWLEHGLTMSNLTCRSHYYHSAGGATYFIRLFGSNREWLNRAIERANRARLHQSYQHGE